MPIHSEKEEKEKKDQEEKELGPHSMDIAMLKDAGSMGTRRENAHS